MSPFKNLFQLIISPKSGWRTISASNASSESVATSMMYPIIGIYAIIVFLIEIKFTELRSESGLDKAVQYAAVAFIQFFAAYYAISYISSKIFKHINSKSCNIYLMYLLAASTLFYAIMTIFSQYTMYIAPLSLYILYLTWTGYSFLSEKETKPNSMFVITISSLVLLLPPVISLILKLLLTII